MTKQPIHPEILGSRIFACALSLFLSLPWTAPAATVQVWKVGNETGTAANGYSVQSWSSSSVAKIYDWNGSEVFGSAGYIQFRPGPANFSQPVSDGNDLGVNETSNPTLLSRPSFLSSVTGGAGSFVNFSAYQDYLHPDGISVLNQGALSVSVNSAAFGPDAGNLRRYGIALHFTVNPGAKFRIGLAVDSVGDGQYAPHYVGLYSAATGTTLSDLLTRDGNADMAFFDIDTTAANLGTNFDVALWQRDGTQSVAALSLVTFDAIPEPSTGILLLVGMGCLAIRSRRR